MPNIYKKSHKSFLLISSFILLFFFTLIFVGKVSAQIACSGLTSTQRSSDDMYKLTAFGCVDGYSDPNDNCEPAHGNPPEYCSAGMSGPDCEREIEWYAANTDMFGVWKKILVTRPDTGKSVVVLTIDRGPHCDRERQFGPLLDVSYSAAVHLGPSGGNYETVKAVPVPDNTPLGPTDGSDIPQEEGGDSSGEGGNRTATGCFVTAVGSPNEDEKPICETSSGSFGVCQEAPPPPSDIKQAIIDKWGITLNLNNNQLALAWEEFHEIDCTGFLQDLRGTLVNSWGSGYAQQFSCPNTSGEQGETDVMFSSQWGGDFMKAILIHELTHVWQLCTSRGEQNKIGNDDAVREESWLTNYSRSGGCGFSVDPYKEDHADAIALYLNPQQGELTCGGGRGNPFSGGAFPIHSSNAESAVGKKSTGPNVPPGVGPLPF